MPQRLCRPQILRIDREYSDSRTRSPLKRRSLARSDRCGAELAVRWLTLLCARWTSKIGALFMGTIAGSCNHTFVADSFEKRDDFCIALKFSDELWIFFLKLDPYSHSLQGYELDHRRLRRCHPRDSG